MPTLDSSAEAALVGSVVAPAFFIFLDVSGDPIRFTTFGSDCTFSSTGDADLDGNTFTAFGGSLVDVGDVTNSESGSETLNITLSGIVGLDSDLLNDIGDKSLWQGRLCRLWFQLYDETGVTPQGAIAAYYTGYMSSVRITAAPKSQTISLSVENYLAYTTQASNRSYLNQKDYDSADTSAAATLTAANGVHRTSGASSGAPAPSGGSGSGGGDLGLAGRSAVNSL
jgi:hypothetical protein